MLSNPNPNSTSTSNPNPNPITSLAVPIRHQRWPCLVTVSAAETSSDEMLPSLMFALIASGLRTPAAECAFIIQFIPPSVDLNGEAGYALASFECAILGVAGLPMDPTTLVLK